MIDWTQVKTGETELIDCNGDRKLVVGQDDQMFWLKMGCCYYTNDKSSMECWTIYDPWIDVSHECAIDTSFNIRHKGNLLIMADLVSKRYKVGPGLRVYERKVGKP